MFGEGPLRKDLLRLTRSLGLEEQVRFRGFRSDVRNLLPGYRAYVHACYSESFCLAIVEAMAAGLPVVVGNIGPVSELCDDGVEARFWPLDDPALAALTLIDLLDCEPARLRAASAASERFRREFDAEVIVPRLVSFLLEGFKDPGAAGREGREEAALGSRPWVPADDCPNRPPPGQPRWKPGFLAADRPEEYNSGPTPPTGRLVVSSPPTRRSYVTTLKITRASSVVNVTQMRWNLH